MYAREFLRNMDWERAGRLNRNYFLQVMRKKVIAYFGASSEALEAWRKKHRGFMRLAVGIFLIVLGAYMLYSINIF